MENEPGAPSPEKTLMMKVLTGVLILLAVSVILIYVVATLTGKTVADGSAISVVTNGLVDLIKVLVSSTI